MKELETFERLDGQLGALLLKQDGINIDISKATEDVAALEREKAAQLAEAFDEVALKKIGRALTTKQTEIRNLNALQSDLMTAIGVAREKVVQTEEEARRALLKHWQEEEVSAMEEALSAAHTLAPWVRLYWARRGAFGGSMSVEQVIQDLRSAIMKLIQASSPDLPLSRPDSSWINDIERADIRSRLRSKSSPPEAA